MSCLTRQVDTNSKNVFGQPRLRASLRDLRSPRRAYKSTIEDDLKKLIIMDGPGEMPQSDPVSDPTFVTPQLFFCPTLTSATFPPDSLPDTPCNALSPTSHCAAGAETPALPAQRTRRPTPTCCSRARCLHANTRAPPTTCRAKRVSYSWRVSDWSFFQFGFLHVACFPPFCPQCRCLHQSCPLQKWKTKSPL